MTTYDTLQVDIGNAPDDDQCDPLRTAFDKINQRFAELRVFLNNRGDWAPNTAYTANPNRDWVIVNGVGYLATSNHTSGATFAADLAAGKWVEADALLAIQEAQAASDAVDALRADLASTAAGKGAELVAFKQAGTGAVERTVTAKLREFVSVKDFGAVGDGVTDDTAAIQAAITGHLNVYLPPGTYLCGLLTLRSNQQLIGAGQDVSVILHKASTNTFGLYGTGVNNVRVASLTLDGNSANNLTGGMGLRIEGASNRIKMEDVRATNWRLDGLANVGTGSYFDVVNCYVDNNLRDGVSCTFVTPARVTNSRLVGNGRFGAVFGAGCDFSRLTNNVISGNSATDALGAGGLATNCTDVVFSGNQVSNNTLGHGLQFNTVTRGTMVGNTSQGNGISGLDSFASTYVTISGNVSFSNAVRGIEIDSAAYYNVANANIVYRNGEAGISVYRSPGTIVSNNFALENGTTGAAKFGIRLWDDLNTLPSSNCRLIGNTCTDDRGGSATQTHGISIEANSTVNTVLLANNLTPNVTGAVSFALNSQISAAKDNIGFVTKNRGTATIASGTTSVVVTHGLAVTPAAQDITVIATNGGTNDPGDIWISGITSTQFTINCRVDPGAGGINFAWTAGRFQ